MIDKYFSLTQMIDKKSSFNELVPGCGTQLVPGVYNDGLLNVVDEELGKRMLISWESFLGVNSVGLAYTSFGDVIYFNNKKNAVHILIPQQNLTNHISVNVEDVLKKWLSIPGVISDVLKEHQKENIEGRIGVLAYGECYIHEPYQVFGGKESPENYVKGDIEVYLDLVAQVLNHSRISPTNILN